MRFGKTPLPSAAPGITSVQGKAVLATAPTWRLHKPRHTVSQPWRENVFLNREKQTRDDSVTCAGAQGATLAQGEVFGEAL